MSKARSSGRSNVRVRRAVVAMAALSALGVNTSVRGASYFWAGDNAANPTLWNATSGLGGTNWSSSPDFNQSVLTLPGSGPSDDVFFYLLPNNLSTTLGQNFSI